MDRITKRTILVALILLASSGVSVQAGDDFFVLDAGNPQTGDPPRVHGGKNPLTLPAGPVPPSSMALTTVPDYNDWGFSFITDGKDVHMIHYASTGPEHTFDLAADGHLSSGMLILNDVSAARPVRTSLGNSQYALYVVGFYVQGWDPPKPYYFVLDQEAMLMRFETDEDLPPYILGQGFMCPDDPCSGLAGEVQVFSRTANAEHQEAFVQTLEFTINPFEQRILRLSRTDAPTNAWRVALEADLDAGLFDFPNMSFAADRVDGTPYAGVGGQVLNLDTDQLGCKLGDIVSDLSIWSLSPTFFQSFTSNSYTFASVQAVAGTSKLVGFPTGTCPNYSETSSISIPVAHKAIKTLIYQTAENAFWVRVLSQDNTVTSIELEITPGGGTQPDKIDILQQSTEFIGVKAVDFGAKPINLGECKYVQSTEDGLLLCADSCWNTENGERRCWLNDAGGTDPEPTGCIDPEDPRCRSRVGGGPIRPVP